MRSVLLWAGGGCLALTLGLVANAAGGTLHLTGDTFWALRTGQWILSPHRIPADGLWSWPRAHTPWINIEWLRDTLTAAAVAVVGPVGLLLWSGVLVASILGGFWLLAGWRGFTPALLTLWVLASFSPAWRPQLAAYALWTLWLGLMARGRTQPRVVWILPVLMALWVNLEGSYLLAGAAMVLWAWDRRQEAPQAWRQWLLPCLATVVAVALTPWGIGGFLHAWQESQNPAIWQSIAEWASPSFHGPAAWVVLVAPAVTLGVIAWRRPAIPRAHRWLWAAAAVSFILSLIAVRSLPFWWISAAACWATTLRDLPPLRAPVWLVTLLWVLAGTGLVWAAPQVVTVRTTVPARWVTILRHQPGRVWNTYGLGDDLV